MNGNNEYIMQMRPWFGIEERAALDEYMSSDGFLTEFRKTHEFETLLAQFTGAKHCFAVNNGTVSLTVAALALGIKPGDEVIVPNYTMIATPNSVQILGAKPVFVDVEPRTLCMDYHKLKEVITERTKAIMLVSANGRFPSTPVEKYIDLCKQNNIAVIEDAAQGLGSVYPDGTHIGLKGCIGSISFSAPKIISTGQGGALITNDDEIANRIKKLKDFGRTSGGNDVHDDFGYNFKFTEMQAVIGIEQMKKLPWRVVRKKEIYKRYQRNLKEVPQISFFDHDFDFTSPWFIDCLVERRDELKSYLHGVGIGTRDMYPPINKQKIYRESSSLVVSNHVGQAGLWLPSMAQLSDVHIDYVSDKIKNFYGWD